MNAPQTFPAPVTAPWSTLVTCIRNVMHENPALAIMHANQIADEAEALARMFIERNLNTKIACAARWLVVGLEESDPTDWHDCVDDLDALLMDEPREVDRTADYADFRRDERRESE